MLEAFLNIKTERVISTDIKDCFLPFMPPKLIWILWKNFFEQWSQLQVAKCLIVHVLSSSYNVSRLELRNKRNATQQWILCVANDIVLNEVCVYHERVYAYTVASKFWFVRSLSSQNHSNFITDLTSENVSQICAKGCKTRSIICKVYLNFLLSSRHFNCDTNFALIMSLLSESVHGFNNIVCKRSQRIVWKTLCRCI